MSLRAAVEQVKREFPDAPIELCRIGVELGLVQISSAEGARTMICAGASAEIWADACALAGYDLVNSQMLLVAALNAAGRQISLVKEQFETRRAQA